MAELLRHAQLQSNRYHQHNLHSVFFTGWMPDLSPKPKQNILVTDFRYINSSNRRNNNALKVNACLFYTVTTSQTEEHLPQCIPLTNGSDRVGMLPLVHEVHLVPKAADAAASTTTTTFIPSVR